MTPAEDIAARFGCLGCLVNRPAGHCMYGNELGDEYCQKERKLNTRATSECLRKGCISAQHVENHTLVCTHNETTCHHLDRLGNSYGNLLGTRPLSDVIDDGKVLASRRILTMPYSRKKIIIEEVPNV